MKYIVTLVKPLDEKGEKAFKNHTPTKNTELEYSFPDEDALIMASDSLSIYSVPHKALVVDDVLDTTKEVFSPWGAHDRIMKMLDTMSPMYQSWTMELLMTTQALNWKPEHREEMMYESLDRAIEMANELEESSDLEEAVTMGCA